MAGRTKRSVYSTRYFEAVEHFNKEEFEQCLRVARYSLSDPTLPRYHRMKNLLLVACAEDDWYEAERCRRTTEDVWATAHRLTFDHDEIGQKALTELREGLDELARTQAEDAPEEIDEELLTGADEEDVEMDYELEEEMLEDAEAARAAHAEVLNIDPIAVMEQVALEDEVEPSTGDQQLAQRLHEPANRKQVRVEQTEHQRESAKVFTNVAEDVAENPLSSLMQHTAPNN